MKFSETTQPILVVDDEPAILDVMSINLKKMNIPVYTTGTGEGAIASAMERDFSVIILDYNLPDMNGFQIFEELKKIDKDITVIMITAYGTIEMAVEAMKAGAFNYLVKPINFDEMALVVEKAIEYHELKKELGALRQLLEKENKLFIGKSRVMSRLYERVLMVAESDATVLIRGETGTGKELVARAIHSNSDRKNGNFVRINCAAIPETLLEAELFGYEKGSFTGALKQKIGKFEMANNGTMYLDEIGDISDNVQTKLLRVLQEGEFDRLGGNKTLSTNSRIIATTNRNLEEAIEQNKFRMDLFYRLNVIPVFVPPLRERIEDIPLLVNHFANKYGEKNGKEIKKVSPSFIAALSNHDWPGNIRELENLVERAVVLTQGSVLENVEYSGITGNGKGRNTSFNGLDFRSAKRKVVEGFESKYLTEMLKKHKGNISASSRESGLDYKNFHCKLKKYKIKKKEFED